MISLTKFEIAEYLKDYSILSEQIRLHPKMRIGDIYNFTYFNEEKHNVEYFSRMINVYNMITYMRMFSIMEDFEMDYLNENELDFDKEEMFVDKNDAKYFSKKQIIKYIRNAFNHSDGDKELYKISVNGRFIEIHLKNTKPKQFHVKLNVRQLESIKQEINDKKHNVLLTTFNDENLDIQKPYLRKNIEDLELVRIYFPKKISDSVLQKLSNISTENQIEGIRLAESILKSEGIDYRIDTFPIKEEQIRKLQTNFYGLKNINTHKNNPDLNEMHNELKVRFIYHILNEILPLGVSKIGQLDYEINFSSWFMADLNITYEKIEKILTEVSMATPNKELEYIGFDLERYNYFQKFYRTYFNERGFSASIELISYTKDYDTRLCYPLINYLSYIINNIYEGDEIIIDEKSYSKEHIRNSFTHGRWFIGKNKTLELYDCPNGFANDYNFNWHESIELKKLILVIKNELNKKKGK